MIEHINLRVPSIEKTQAFLKAAFPDFKQRGQGYGDHFGYWSHFGNDQTYIALLQADAPGSESDEKIPDYQYEDRYRLMHIAYAINNIDDMRERLSAAGYQPDALHLNDHPHRKRIYYLDGNGIEWEFIEYLTDVPALKNDYAL